MVQCADIFVCPAAGLQTKYCSSITLKPRTMDELTDLAALLLVRNMHHFPSLTSLRLEMLVGGVKA